MNFIEYWKQVQYEAFRLELLNEYDVEEEREHFLLYKQGKKVESKALEEWLKEIDTLRSKGAALRRVHVVDLPLSTYLHYEIECWYYPSQQHGAQIFFIKRQDYKKLPKELEPKDFWLFDGKVVIVFNYDHRGRFLSEKVLINKGDIQPYIKLKNKILSIAIPMQEFLRNI